MTGRVFLDSNVLIYAADARKPEWQKTARLLIDANRDTGVISTQVLQETYSTLTVKAKMVPYEAKEYIRVLQRLSVVYVTPMIIEDAIDISILAQVNFWDAVIIAAASSANCSTLYTEDLNNGQVIRGVRIVNPFLKQ